MLYLAKNKLDCVEILISNSIKDGVIDHEELLEIMKEKKNYDCLENEEKTETVKFFFFYLCNIKWFLLLLKIIKC